MKVIFCILQQIIKPMVILAFCISAWLFLFSAFALLTSILLILLIWRKFVDICLVRRCHPDWIPVKPPDCMFSPTLDLKPDLTMANIGILFHMENPIFDKETTLHVLRESFRSNIMRMPGDPFWKMKHVPRKLYEFYYWAPIDDLDFHLEEYIHELHFGNEIQRPGNIDELHDYLMNHWVSTNYEGKSPWEIVVAEATDGQRSMAFRWNHMVGGGLSMRWFLQALNGVSVDESMAPFMRKDKPCWLRFLWDFIQLMYDLLTLPWTLLYMTCISIVRACSDKFDEPQEICTQVVTAKHIISVDSVKRIAKHFKTPFRTVLAATLGSAKRSFELESCKESRLPGSTQIYVNLPWSYAQLNPTEPMNNISTGCLVNYPLKCSRASKRLTKTNARIQSFLSNRIDRFFFYYRYLTYVIPAFVIKRMILSPPPIANSSSDVPFTMEKHFAVGDQYTKSMYGLAGINGTKIGCIALFATIGKFLTLSLIASKEIIPTNSDAEKLCNHFQQELEYLEEFIDSSSEPEYKLPQFGPPPTI